VGAPADCSKSCSYSLSSFCKNGVDRWLSFTVAVAPAQSHTCATGLKRYITKKDILQVTTCRRARRQGEIPSGLNPNLRSPVLACLPQQAHKGASDRKQAGSQASPALTLTCAALCLLVCPNRLTRERPQWQWRLLNDMSAHMQVVHRFNKF